jgi:hypothetical protein
LLPFRFVELNGNANPDPLLHICSTGRPIQACTFSQRHETGVCYKRRLLFHKWGIIVCNGIIRVYEYNPQGTFAPFLFPRRVGLIICHVLDPDSGDGRHLLLRTEFHGQSEYRTSTVIARRLKEDSDIPQSKLLMGKDSAVTYFYILI